MHSAAFEANHGSLTRTCSSTFRSRCRGRAMGESAVDRHLNVCSEPYLSLGTPPVS